MPHIRFGSSGAPQGKKVHLSSNAKRAKIACKGWTKKYRPARNMATGLRAVKHLIRNVHSIKRAKEVVKTKYYKAKRRLQSAQKADRCHGKPNK
mgnify:CR=1 FL=1